MESKTKKIISSLLIAANIAIPANITLAKEEAKTHSEVKVYFNDEKIEFDQQPIVIKGRTKVPFRAIFETMGTVVYYRESDSSILGLTRDGDTIYHVIGTNKATINGVEKKYDSVSEIKNDRTLIPIRMVADLLSAKVEWNEKKQTVEIEKEITTNEYNKKVRGILGCVLDQNFNPEDFKRYLDYQYKHWNMDPKQVIIDVNMDLDRELVLISDDEEYGFGLQHYGPKPEDIEIVKNPHDPLVYLNKFNRLPDGFEPTDIEVLRDIEMALESFGGSADRDFVILHASRVKLKPEVNAHFKQMCAENSDSLSSSVEEDFYYIIDGYRPVDHIEWYYRLNWHIREDDIYQRLRFDCNPEPYHTELQTGYAFTYLLSYDSNEARELNIRRLGLKPQSSYTLIGIDLNSKEYENMLAEFEWLENNSYKYGIIQRYPKDKEHITRYLYQPHIYRYVGVDVAKIMHDNNWCFDEYYARYLVESEYKTDLESTKKKVLERY